MSVNNCYGTPNNVYNNFPGITNDGSLFTSYQPAGQYNLSETGGGRAAQAAGVSDALIEAAINDCPLFRIHWSW